MAGKGFFLRGELYSVLNTGSLNWLLSVDVVLSAADSDTFTTFLASVIVPRMRRFPYNNLLLNNCWIHSSDEEWIELVHEKGR